MFCRDYPINIKNRYDHASKILKKKREQLISGFLNRRDSLFLEHHARILDDYFRESFERSEVGFMISVKDIQARAFTKRSKNS